MPSDRLWRPNLIVFTSNACIMIIELVAGRMVAPYLGVSLYTWTSVIGVILAGISLGNYVGGKLADRWASRRLLGLMFLLSGLACLSVLVSTNYFGQYGTPAGWPLMARILLFVTAIFFLPGALLGTISPLVVKLTLSDLNTTGNVVGQIHAASAAGSIAGTFATGFFLISWFGTRSIVVGVGLALILLGILLGRWRQGWKTQTVAAAAVVGLLVLPPFQSLRQGPCLQETNYFCIKVHDRELEDGKEVRVLVLDRLVHSYTSLQDPTHLVYSYEKVYAEATAYLMQRVQRPRALFIGGGGYTFPKYLEALYPHTEIDVVEIDPAVTQIAYNLLGLDPATRIRSFNLDARQYLIGLDPALRYDLILGDAFDDYSVPYHLTTHEFNQLIRRHLNADGLYMVNLIDGHQHHFLAAFVRTLQQTFPHVYVTPMGTGWADVVRTTFVVLASQNPIDEAALRRQDGGDGSREIDRWLLPSQDLTELLARPPQIYLSDDYVPVDNLLATVFEDSAAGR